MSGLPLAPVRMAGAQQSRLERGDGTADHDDRMRHPPIQPTRLAEQCIGEQGQQSVGSALAGGIEAASAR